MGWWSDRQFIRLRDVHRIICLWWVWSGLRCERYAYGTVNGALRTTVAYQCYKLKIAQSVHFPRISGSVMTRVILNMRRLYENGVYQGYLLGLKSFPASFKDSSIHYSTPVEVRLWPRAGVLRWYSTADMPARCLRVISITNLTQEVEV
jgi:hypothetical protein